MKTICLLLIGSLLVGGATVALGQEGPTDQDAATVIDDFDSGYEEEGIEEAWWTYTDDLPDITTFQFGLGQDVVYNGTDALWLEFDIAAGGHAGIGFDYGIPCDWREGSGIVLQIRASEVGLPLVFALHVTDDTQTSGQSPGLTPFAYRFETPPGSVDDWVTLVMPWEKFERLMWVGDAGIMEFTPNPISKVEIGFEAPDDARLTGSIWVDDIRVISTEDLNAAPSFEELLPPIPPIQASQVGYRPEDRKMFVSTEPMTHFTVVDDASGEVVYTGRAVRWGYDEDSQKEIYWGRFNSLDTPGRYRIVVEDVGESYPFDIGDDVFVEPIRLAARAFYLQRSGIDINDSAISGLEIEAGHLQEAVLWDDPTGDVTLDVHGGWYDAGDYGRYITTAAFSINQLLTAYRANPDLFTDGMLDIPESGNGIPDLLDEIRWELEWMLRMQRDDGVVYHKVTTHSFPPFGAPSTFDDDNTLYVFGPTSADTAYFAAAMAQASTIFEPHDAEFAATCLDAAERAWAWLEEHPEQLPPGGFHNPPPGEYPMQGGYDLVESENIHHLWAAAELFRATGEARYETAFAEYLEALETSGKVLVHHISWADIYPMGLFAYLTAEDSDPAIRAQAAEIFEREAQIILDVTFRSGYQVALRGRDGLFAYVWGSNQVTLANGLYMMLANELFPDPRYVHAARAQVQYILGINPLAKTYFSGVGTDQVLHPHHNMAYHTHQAIPGFVGEGANGAIGEGAGGDAQLEAMWTAKVPPALDYIDDWNSWATNEPTIDANATFLALAAYFAP